MMAEIDPSGNLNANVVHAPSERTRFKFISAIQDKKFVSTQISLFPFSDRSLVLGLHIATGEVRTSRLLQAFNLSTPAPALHTPTPAALHTAGLIKMRSQLGT